MALSTTGKEEKVDEGGGEIRATVSRRSRAHVGYWPGQSPARSTDCDLRASATGLVLSAGGNVLLLDVAGRD
jgi:hypothetical protein